MQVLVCAILLACAAVGNPGVAAAQSPLPISVEVRADAVFPIGDFADYVNTGVGIGGSVALQIIPNIGLYGGYSRTTFDFDEIPNARAIDSGFAVGLTAGLPGFSPDFAPWVGAGVLIHDMEVEGVQPEPIGDSSIGFEVGAGVAIPILPRVRLTPAVGFRRFTAPLPGRAEAAISYIGAGIGLNLAL